MPVISETVLRTLLELRDVNYGSGLRRATDQTKKFAAEIEAAELRATRWARVATVAGAGAVAIGTGLGFAVKSAANVEQITIGFRTILGSAEAAQAKVEELQEFAKNSPFNFTQAARGAQQLAAMGFKAQELIPIMTAAGNAVAAAGGGNEQFLGVLTALGQVRTSGRLLREEMNQLTQRGIPAFEILQEELGLSADQMRNLGEQGIPARRALDALQRGFNKRFAGGMDAQAKSLAGSWSSLQDAGEQLGAGLGKTLVPTLTFITRSLTSLVETVNKAPAPIKTLVSVIAVGAVGALTAFAGYAWWNANVVIPRYIQSLNALAAAHGRATTAAGAHTVAQAVLGKTVTAGSGANALGTAAAGAGGAGLLGRMGFGALAGGTGALGAATPAALALSAGAVGGLIGTLLNKLIIEPIRDVVEADPAIVASEADTASRTSLGAQAAQTRRRAQRARGMGSRGAGLAASLEASYQAQLRGEKPAVSGEDQALAELRKIAALLTEIKQGGKTPVAASDIPVAFQLAALGRAIGG